jgi:hypothetical protein
MDRHTHTLVWGFIQDLAGGTEGRSENLQSGLSILVRFENRCVSEWTERSVSVRCANFSNLFCKWNYMFWTVPLSIIRSYSLYTQRWYMSYRFVDSFQAGSGWMEFLVHLVGFIIRKFVTMHSHMNVKLVSFTFSKVAVNAYVHVAPSWREGNDKSRCTMVSGANWGTYCNGDC